MKINSQGNAEYPLVHDGYRYYHSTVTTSPFGGKMIDKDLQRHDIANNHIEKLSSEQWNDRMIAIGEEMGLDKFNNTVWDLVWHNPFIDYR